MVASNLAAAGAKGQLPQPLALMSVEPGMTWPETSRIAFPLDDLSILPPELLVGRHAAAALHGRVGDLWIVLDNDGGEFESRLIRLRRPFGY